MKILFQKLAVFIAMWMILSSVGETLFYSLDITWEYILLFVIYGLYWYFMMYLLYYYKISSFAGLFLAASIFWFLLEGGFVGILYESLPFSLVWTSLAWHALISVVLFWYYFRKIMLWKSLKKKLLYNSSLWILLWLWGTYSWSASEIWNSWEVVFNWMIPQIYISQIVIWYVLFIFWHMIYERSVKSMQYTSKKEWYIILTWILISYIIWNGILYFPVSLLLPVLIILSVMLLSKEKNKTNLWISHDIDTQVIKNNDYFITLMIPIFAGIIYMSFYYYKIELEMNAFYFLTGWIVSIYLFVKSCFYMLKK